MPTASAPGGTAIVADPVLALSDNLTDAVSWSVPNLASAGGAQRGWRASSRIRILVTPEMIAHGTHKWEVQHAVEGFSWIPYTASGAIKVGAAVAPADTLTESGGVFTLTLAGGITDLVDTDYIIVETWGTVSLG